MRLSANGGDVIAVVGIYPYCIPYNIYLYYIGNFRWDLTRQEKKNHDK